MTPAQSRLLLVLALVAATLAMFTLIDRYQVRLPQILLNGDFSDGLSDWQAAGQGAQLQLDQGVLRIRAEAPGQSIGLRQTIERDPSVDRVRLSAWVRHTGISAGRYTWNAMRLLLVQKDGKGNDLWELPHVVAQERGDGPWRHVSRVFWLPPRVKAMEVTAVLSRVTGQMQVRDLTLAVLREHTAFTFARYGLVAVWLFTVPWLVWPLFRRGPGRRGRLALTVLAVIILAGALTPHAAKNQLHRLVDEMAQSFKAEQGQVAPGKADPAAPTAASATSADDNGLPISEIWRMGHKLGHVVLFTLLALAAALTLRRQSWWRLSLYLCVFAVAAETVQLLSLDRTSQVTDAGLNILGVISGLALGRYIPHLVKSLKPQS
ncbi:MAG: VanZ family protein [Alphaproteobacteria bacterium]|nr:VanZ family protein [Alphaproteobacteria bacterium]